MDGSTYTGQYAPIYGSYVPVAWRIMGAANFTGDGQHDLVWQNVSTGDVGIWPMNGATWSGTHIALAAVPVQWRVAAAADFTGDSKPDLVWQNTQTGERGLWVMNGTSFTGQYILLYPQLIPTPWTIAAAADLSGDGKADLVWQNSVSGERGVWVMNGTIFVEHRPVYSAYVPLAWDIAGAADFSGDGKADLVWQNTATGERGAWVMNGTTFTGQYLLLYPGLVPTSWDVAAVIPAGSTPATHPLTITGTTGVTRGSARITSVPAGIDCQVTRGVAATSGCSAQFPAGSTVQLSHQANTGSQFTGWGAPCSGTGPCTVSMTGSRSVSADVATPWTYSITITPGTSTGSGRVTSSVEGPGTPINCGVSAAGTTETCTASYPSSSVVVLTASPSTGSTFSGWQGHICAQYAGTNPQCHLGNIAGANAIQPTFVGSQPVATKLGITTQPFGAVSGVPFTTQPVVQLQSAIGIAVGQAGVVVTASKGAGSGTLTGTLTATTNSSGVATFSNLRIDGTGAHTITFSATGLSPVTSSAVDVASAVPMPTALAVVVQPAGAVSGSPFGTQPEVELRDAGGNPVSKSGVSVTASRGSGSGTLTGSVTVSTNASGRAVFTNLGISGTGGHTLAFAAAGLTGATSSSFTVSQAAGVATQIIVSRQPAGAYSGLPYATQPQVTVVDANLNPVASATGIIDAKLPAGSSCTRLTGTLEATLSSGVATFSNLGIEGSSSCRVGFSYRGKALDPVNSNSISVSQPARLTFATSPAGLSGTLAGSNVTGPATIDWYPAQSRSMGTSSPQSPGLSSGSRYEFTGWSDGVSTLSRDVVLGAAGSTISRTANFKLRRQVSTAAAIPSGAGSLAVTLSGNAVTSGSYVDDLATLSLAQAPANITYRNGGYSVTVAGSAAAWSGSTWQVTAPTTIAPVFIECPLTGQVASGPLMPETRTFSGGECSLNGAIYHPWQAQGGAGNFVAVRPTTSFVPRLEFYDGLSLKLGASPGTEWPGNAVGTEFATNGYLAVKNTSGTGGTYQLAYSNCGASIAAATNSSVIVDVVPLACTTTNGYSYFHVFVVLDDSWASFGDDIRFEVVGTTFKSVKLEIVKFPFSTAIATVNPGLSIDGAIEADLGSAPAGMYMLRVTGTGGGSATVKIFKK